MGLTSFASPAPLERTVKPVTADPPSFPTTQEIMIAVRYTSDAVGGGHAPGGTAGVRTE